MEIGALVKELQSGISARGTSGYWEMPRVQGRGGADGGGERRWHAAHHLVVRLRPARPRDVPDRRPLPHHRGGAAHRRRAWPPVRRHRARRHRLRLGRAAPDHRRPHPRGRRPRRHRPPVGDAHLGRRARAHDRVRRVPRGRRRVLRRSPHVGRGAQLRAALWRRGDLGADGPRRARRRRARSRAGAAARAKAVD